MAEAIQREEQRAAERARKAGVLSEAVATAAAAVANAEANVEALRRRGAVSNWLCRKLTLSKGHQEDL
jgi:hypothetical protein